MKSFLAASFCLIGTVAYAADQAPKPAAPTCGKTAEECQKQVEDLTNRLAQATLKYSFERQQRAQLQISISDHATEDYVAQQSAAAAAKK